VVQVVKANLRQLVTFLKGFVVFNDQRIECAVEIAQLLRCANDRNEDKSGFLPI
jgi:hypothetical protein